MKSTIKTIVVVVLTMLLVFTSTSLIVVLNLIGCGSMEDLRELMAWKALAESISQIETSEVENIVEEDVAIDVDCNCNQETVTPPSATDNVFEEKTQDKFEGIEPLCIWNMNGIKITVLGLEMNGFYGPEMYIEIENNTDKNLLFGIEDVAVNGFMMDPFWATTVTAGNKARETITWFEESCIENGIDDIVRVEVVFRVSDADTWATIIETPTIRIDFE